MIKIPNIIKLFKSDPVCNTVIFMLSIFIVMDVSVPREIAKSIDTFCGTLSIIVLSVYLLYYKPIVGIVFALAGYELIKRSSGFGVKINGFYKKFIPGETNKYNKMKNINNFPYTVEELVINSTIPYSYNKTDNVGYEDSENDTHLAENVQ